MILLFFIKQTSGGKYVELPLFVNVSEMPVISVDMQQDYEMFNTLPGLGLQ
jgi:hypothetical protein